MHYINTKTRQCKFCSRWFWWWNIWSFNYFSVWQNLRNWKHSAGEVVEFSVSEQYVVDPVNEGVRFAFSGWSDGNTPNQHKFYQNGWIKTITANWSKQYGLKILDSTQDMDIIGVSWHNENSAPLTVNNFDAKSDGLLNELSMNGLVLVQIMLILKIQNPLQQAYIWTILSRFQ